LLARIRAVLRRTGKGGQSENQIVESCGVRLNSGTREVWLNGKPVKITAIEFDILDYLMRAAGRLVSRDALAAVLYQREATPFERSIDVHISHLRRKLGKGDEEVIHTMRGAGYLFCPACGTRRMRSIFAKIVVWSFGTLVLSLGAFFLVTAMMMRRPEPGKGMLPRPSGVVEGLNNKAKVTMRRSYGFRTFRTLELALYHSLGKLPEPDSTHEFF
jgi:hypothetical protein